MGVAAGVVQPIRSVLLPTVATTSVGAPGTSVGVTVTSSEAGPGSPLLFRARTWKVWRVLPVRPVTVWEVVAPEASVHAP